ncbi:MAG: hypothetical protein AB7G11_00225 [Phycisphaerales bacterium]
MSLRTLTDRARRRLFAGALLHRAGQTFSVGAVTACALILADRIIGLGVDWPLLAAGPVALSAAAAILLATRDRRSPLSAAARIDLALQLKDRLGSGVWLATAPAADDPFAALALAEADAAASSVDLRRAIPIRPGRACWLAAALLPLAVAAGVWMPRLAWARLSGERVAAAKADESRRILAAQEIARAAAEVLPPVEPPAGESADAATADASSTEQRARLNEIEQALRAGSITPDEARARSSDALEQSAADLDARAKAQERLAAATQDHLARLAQRPESADSSPAQTPLARSLRQGDLKSARDAVRELARQAPRLSPEERARYADELERLAQDIGSIDQPPAPPDSPGAAPASADEPRKPRDPNPDSPDAGPSEPPPGSPASDRSPLDPDLAQELREQGLTPRQIDSLTNEHRAEDAQRRLEDVGVPREPAQDLARKLADDAARRQADAEARQQARDLADSLKQTADDLRQPPAAPNANPPRDSTLPSSAPNPRSPTGPKPDSTRPDPAGADPGSSNSPQPSPAAKPPTDPGSDQQSAERFPAPADSNAPKSADSKGPATKPAAPPNAPSDGGPSPTDSKPSSTSDSRPKPESQPAPAQGTDSTSSDQPRPGTDTRPGSDGTKESPPGREPGSEPKPAAPQGTTPTTPETDPNPARPGANSPSASPDSAKPTTTKSDPGARPGAAPDPQSAPADNPRDAGSKPAAGENGPSNPSPAGNQPAPGEHPQQRPAHDKNPSGPSDSPADHPSPSPANGSQAIDKLLDQLEQMDKPARDAARNRQASEQQKQRAKELLDSLSPEEKERLRERARRWAQQERQRPETPDPATPDPASPSSPDPDSSRPDASHPPAGTPDAEPRRPDSPGADSPAPSAGDPSSPPDHPRGPEPARTNAPPGNDAADSSLPRPGGRSPAGREPAQPRPSGREADPVSDQPRGDAGAQDGLHNRSATPQLPNESPTVPVDARANSDDRDSSDARVIAEWLSGDQRRAGADDVSRRQVEQAVQRARQSAERAVENRTISRRYDSILKRYFDRLPRKVLPTENPADGAGR